MEDSIRILFIDDEPAVLRSLERVLRADAERFEMHFCPSSADALVLLRRQAVDIVVSDLRMPVPDGRQLLEIVRRERPQIVRILMSGHITRDRGLDDESVQRFFEKPWDPSAVRRLLREAADAIQARHRRIDDVTRGAASQFHRPFNPRSQPPWPSLPPLTRASGQR